MNLFTDVLFCAHRYADARPRPPERRSPYKDRPPSVPLPSKNSYIIRLLLKYNAVSACLLLLFAAGSHRSPVESQPAPEASDGQAIYATGRRRNPGRWLGGFFRRCCSSSPGPGVGRRAGARRSCMGVAAAGRRLGRIIVVMLERAHRVQHQQLAMSRAAARRPLAAHRLFAGRRPPRVSAADLQSARGGGGSVVGCCGRRMLIMMMRRSDVGRGQMARRDLIVQRVALLSLHQHATSPVDRVGVPAAARVRTAATDPGRGRQVVGRRRQETTYARRLAREALLLCERVAPISPRVPRPVWSWGGDRQLARVDADVLAVRPVMMLMLTLIEIEDGGRRSTELAEVRQLASPRDDSIRHDVTFVVVVVSVRRQTVSADLRR